MRSWSLRLGRFFGIDVFVHWTFSILLVWIFLMHISGGHGVAGGIAGVLFVLAIFACVVLHEFGHALTAARFGIKTKNITLYPIGGIASLEGMPEKPGEELLVGLAGPMVNLVIAFLIWVYLTAMGQPLDLAAVGSDDMARLPFLWNLLFANVVLAVFNLIPAFPMDGGRVLRSLLSFVMDKSNATRAAATVGQFLAIMFVFLGFFYSFWLVFIGLFVFLGAGGEAAAESMRAALSGLKVRDAVMRRFTLFRPDDTIGRVVDVLLNSQETVFLVADADRPIGTLSRTELIRGLSEQGKDALVSGFMNTDFVVVGPEMKLQDLVAQLPETGGVAAVLEGDSILGLIDRENIEEKLLVQRTLKERNKI